MKNRKGDNTPSVDCHNVWKIDEKAKPYRFAFFTVLFILIWTIYDQARRGAFQAEPPASCTPHLIDVNNADAAELSLLPGIGPALAQKIMLYREQAGPFQRVSDLERVKGLGPAKVFKIAKWILVDEQVRIPTVNRDGEREAKDFESDQ